MADQSEVQIPRLDPLAAADARAAYVQELKALVDNGEYSIPVDAVAEALLSELRALRG